MSRAPFAAWPGWAHLGYAALLSLANSVWFAAVFGGADWLTARRTLRLRVDFPGETRLPFVPDWIVIYMSIYLLFWLAPFVLRTRREFRALIATLAFTILVGGTCFLALPVGLSFAPEGGLGTWPALFRFADDLNLTYNLFPSLHVAFGTVCVAAFAPSASPFGKLLLWLWALGIAVSTVLTRQHHVADALGGFALAAVAMQVVYRRIAKETYPPNFRRSSSRRRTTSTRS